MPNRFPGGRTAVRLACHVMLRFFVFLLRHLALNNENRKPTAESHTPESQGLHSEPSIRSHRSMRLFLPILPWAAFDLSIPGKESNQQLERKSRAPSCRQRVHLVCSPSADVQVAEIRAVYPVQASCAACRRHCKILHLLTFLCHSRGIYYRSLPILALLICFSWSNNPTYK